MILFQFLTCLPMGFQCYCGQETEIFNEILGNFAETFRSQSFIDFSWPRVQPMIFWDGPAALQMLNSNSYQPTWPIVGVGMRIVVQHFQGSCSRSGMGTSSSWANLGSPGQPAWPVQPFLDNPLHLSLIWHHATTGTEQIKSQPPTNYWKNTCATELAFDAI